MNISPIFIIGNPRSGTTLLRLLLNAHSKIIIPPEAGFAFWLYPKYKDFNYTKTALYFEDMKKTKKISNWNINWISLENYISEAHPNNYQELINHIYLYYATKANKPVKYWGDKNNFYLNFIKEIKEVFPNALFIHIIRDGRNIACSYKKLNSQSIKSPDAPKLSNNIKEIAHEWKTNIQTIQSSFNSFKYENVYEVKLEDITSNPITEISKIMNFIGEPFEESMLDYYKDSKQSDVIPSQYLQWKRKNTLPIQNETINKYTSILSVEDINIFNSITKDILKAYNYSI